jgi:MFS family permease
VTVDDQSPVDAASAAEAAAAEAAAAEAAVEREAFDPTIGATFAGGVNPNVGADNEALAAVAAATSAAGSDGGDQASHLRRGWWSRWKYDTTKGAPLFPLGVLFGLNMVDELDRTAFGVLLPEIRDHFGLDTNGILTVVALSLLAALILALPVGFYADRWKRVPIASAGASVWGVFSVLTGLAANLWVLGAARAGAGLGRAVNDPVHNSLLADYYDIPARPRVYAVHRYANALGQFLGPLSAGIIAYAFGWRVPFLVFGVVTFAFVILSFRLHEPVRGHYERKAMGASAEVANTEEVAPSWAESFRIVWQVRTLRRIFVALPFVAVAIVGLSTLSGLYYDEVFNLDERARGFTAAGLEGVAQFAGLMFGIPLTTRLMAKGPGYVVKFLGRVSLGIAVVWLAPPPPCGSPSSPTPCCRGLSSCWCRASTWCSRWRCPPRCGPSASPSAPCSSSRGWSSCPSSAAWPTPTASGSAWRWRHRCTWWAA